MTKQKKALLAIIFITCILSTAINTVGIGEAKEGPASRPDMISIDSMKIFGALEKPEPVFLHDKHTDALEKKGKDCRECHKEKGDKLSPMFMRLENTGRKDVMDIFHNSCIECHKDTTAENDKSGPIVCGECHLEKPNVISFRQPMGLDKSLHFRHSKAHDKKCETCHSDCKTGKYKKETEDTCRACHKDVTEKDRISMEEASHASCLDCHMKTAEKKKDTGPVKCSGCHDLEAQNRFEKVSPVPRMDRKQPDKVMIKTGVNELDAPGKNRMNLVPFNHMAHEGYNDTCRVCHHKSINKCSKCHTLKGSEDGKGVSLEQAMHKMDREQSCIGCHEMKQQDKNCAGCHAVLSKNRKPDDSSCLKCHMELPAGDSGKAGMDEKTAATLLEQRKKVSGTFSSENIPEKIIIKAFSDKYEPVEFPHRDIVNKIVKDIKDNNLAVYFHAGKGTVCQGCHHNSPATKKPTGCGSCHGKPFNEKDMHKPGIIGAYHIQCMECHDNMKIDKVGCTDCHKEKNN